MTKVHFGKKTLFYTELKTRVDEYFIINNYQKSGNLKLYFKGAVLILSALVIYALLLFIAMPLPPLITASALLGFILACIGFNMMHDASHGSYSTKKWINNLAGLTLNALGGNSYIWKYKHNLHHAFTNIDGLDDDIAKTPLMRQCTSQKWVPAHKYQHMYIIVVYALSCLAWITILDFSKYFTKKIHNTEMKKMTFKDHAVFWISKVLYIVFYIMVPATYIGVKEWVIGFSVMQVTTGLTLAFVFQMAHVIEEAEFVSVRSAPLFIENDWAVHQLKSTVNFAPNHKLITWFFGGLNYQIEHHLLPTISHIHYPALSKIVRETCDAFNLPYHTYPTFPKAVRSHFRMMKKLGEKPVLPVLC